MYYNINKASLKVTIELLHNIYTMKFKAINIKKNLNKTYNRFLYLYNRILNNINMTYIRNYLEKKFELIN